MYFKTLKDRMEYFRSVSDYRLTPNSYVIAMVDGKNFSKKVKKIFSLPFDKDFINMMNECAIYACKNIQGCKLAFVQSDEISFVITDFDTPETDSFFSFRLCKIQSIISSLVTSKFQQLFIKYLYDNDLNDEVNVFSEKYLFQFDCKCWTVPEYNDVFGWIKYRQNDCIRNSKQQAAQTYCTYKELVRKNVDEQIALLNLKTNIDWNTKYNNGEKYGRLIYKETTVNIGDDGGSFIRNKWLSHELEPLTRDMFDDLEIVPNRNELFEVEE